MNMFIWFLYKSEVPNSFEQGTKMQTHCWSDQTKAFNDLTTFLSFVVICFKWTAHYYAFFAYAFRYFHKSITQCASEFRNSNS